MPANRRHFLQAVGALGLAAETASARSIEAIAAATRLLGDKPPEEAARDEAFWGTLGEVVGVEEGNINLQTARAGRPFARSSGRSPTPGSA